MPYKETYYKNRWYDGEQEFSCFTCNVREVDYLFDDENPSAYHTAAGIFFAKQTPPCCPKCYKYMSWATSMSTTCKDSISGSILQLLKGEHYLVACLLLSATTEYQLNSLLWAILVDFGYDKEKANEFADGSLSNGEVVRLLQIFLSKKLKTIVLPARNDMVHGREFGNTPDYFIKRLRDMLDVIRTWVASFEHAPSAINPSEFDRWFLYMSHWLRWCEERFPRLENKK